MTAVFPPPFREQAVEHGHEHGGAVVHRDVDDLPDARPPGLQDRAEQADREQHAAAAVVAEEIQRRDRGFRCADRVQRAGERDVVDVVTGHLRVRAVLAPSRHARVHEPRIAREQFVGSDPDAFGCAGTVHVDEPVRVRGQRVHELATARMLHVDRDGPLAATHQRVDRRGPVDFRHAIDAHDIGTEAGEQHAAERRGPQPTHHHDAHTVERPAHLCAHRSRAAAASSVAWVMI